MRIANPPLTSASLPSTAARERVAARSASTDAGHAGDAVRVNISPTARRLSLATAVDPAKVDRLKGQVSSGTYDINHLRVAQAMLQGA
jgi:flagellar biosynthesis anti-sigma factor FlgM